MKFSVAHKKGFTLIELLIVIAIIGILSAITYASFNAAQTQNNDDKKVSDMNLIQLGLQEYYDQQSPHQYPNSSNLQSLVPTYIPDSVNVNNYNYVALAQTSDPKVCTTYQLWTTFQATSSYLQSATGFNSAGVPLPNSTLQYCAVCTAHTCSPGKYTTVNPSVTPFVYDVMPQ